MAAVGAGVGVGADPSCNYLFGAATSVASKAKQTNTSKIQSRGGLVRGGCNLARLTFQGIASLLPALHCFSCSIFAERRAEDRPGRPHDMFDLNESKWHNIRNVSGPLAIE